MFFKQVIQRSDNFSYIIADDSTKEAVVVDPNFNADAIIRIMRDQNLNVKYVINTHDHFDHTASNEDFRSNFGAKIVAHKLSHVNKDISVVDNQIIRVGEIAIKVIHTPGHTQDSICLLVDDKLLTGDTLFVGECGRTDLPGGSAEDMYHSLFDKLMKLDDNIMVYPGHDYGPKPHSTIGVERRTNYVLQKRTVEEFVAFMSEL
jgi:glyoxylase-like metal-dependent hydrolase (beta-lactamase superfamily II)